MAKKPPPTPEYLRQLFDYRPTTGRLTWRAREGKWSSRWNKRHAGKEAGTVHPLGYRIVKVDGRNHGAHRIIWAMTYGCWPECIDHKNGDPLDNRLQNLRAVSRKMNQRNQKRHSRNTSGRTGVYWNRFTNKWVAQIKIATRSHYLGSYDAFDDAKDARIKVEKLYNFTGRQ